MQSVGFTAAPFFIIAAIWFFLFGLCLSLICLCYCCCRREPYGYSKTAYALSLIFLILFTVAAMYILLSLPLSSIFVSRSPLTMLSFYFVVSELDVLFCTRVNESFTIVRQRPWTMWWIKPKQLWRNLTMFLSIFQQLSKLEWIEFFFLLMSELTSMRFKARLTLLLPPSEFGHRITRET